MQTRHYRERQLAPSDFVARVIVETLKQTKGNGAISITRIADQARTTTRQVGRILSQLLQLEDASGAELTSSARFKLAFEAVRQGALQQVARALTWQEFEAFTEECLQNVGFDTKKGIIVNDNSRRWQIDVVAKKGRMILAVDCKHWETPAYDSKLRKAAEHQKLAAQALVRQMKTIGEGGPEGVLALPIILTLFEPRSSGIDGVVVVPIQQFGDFLEGVSPYTTGLPFVLAQEAAKSSISQRVGYRVGLR